VRVYHILPTNFTGSILYSLNALKDVLPEIHQIQSTIYRGQADLVSRKIPYLGCSWNDVIHFSAVHPAQIRGAVESVGLTWKTTHWFEIDVTAIGFDDTNAAIFTAPFRPQGNIADADFIPFTLETLQMLNSIPQASYEYFNHAKAHDERPFLFNCVPHVLYHGTVETDQAGVSQIVV
jgi:hypothetical protein